MQDWICVGGQWGDEGKGKIVDILSAQCDVVVRYQGGNNAGHTLVVDGVRTVLHLIPSGVLHADKTCVVGAGVVVDPEVLLQEIETLRARGLLKSPDRLRISPLCHIIFPYHKRLDWAREKARGDAKIGTTGRGIGPCYEDKVGRRGIRLFEMTDKDRITSTVRTAAIYFNAILDGLGAEIFTGIEIEEMIERAILHGEMLKPFIESTNKVLKAAQAANKAILYEGAQGALLDVDHGTYPYVTSCNCVASHAAAGTGFGLARHAKVVMVAKCYATRVGSGPFPTELSDEWGEMLRTRGSEFGATTGRARRCGWLDLVALKYAVDIHGADRLALTKLDILAGLPRLKLCTAYEVDGVRQDDFLWDAQALARAKPVYEEMPGFDALPQEPKSLSDLPQEARAYLKRISDFVGCPIALVSVGAQRGQELIVEPF